MVRKLTIALLCVAACSALTMTWGRSTTNAQSIGESEGELDEFEPEIDQTIAICMDFVNAETHLDDVSIARQTNDIYKSQREEIAIYDFLVWYQNGGRLYLETAGDFCSLQILGRSGKIKDLQARLYVTDVERRNAEFFAAQMMKRWEDR